MEQNTVRRQTHTLLTSLIPCGNAIMPRSDCSLIRVSGVDAEKFLQGQLSCDVAALRAGEGCLGSANTPKGRAYGVFFIARTDNEYLIRINRSLASAFTERLNKYIVFFKASLEVTEELNILTVYGEQAQIALRAFSEQNPSNTTVIRLSPHQEYLLDLWAPAEAIEQFTHQHPDWQATADTAVALEILHGLPALQTETVEAWVPQMLNLQALGGISFKKGCYTGQEIVARMHYLGKLKKHMEILFSPDRVEIQPGEKLYNQQDEAIGEIVQAAIIESGTLIEAVLPEDLSQETASLVSQGSGFELLELPYTLAAK